MRYSISSTGILDGVGLTNAGSTPVPDRNEVRDTRCGAVEVIEVCVEKELVKDGIEPCDDEYDARRSRSWLPLRFIRMPWA